MDALLALVRDRPAAFTTQPISREFDEAGVKRDRRWQKSYANASTSEIDRRGFCGQFASVG